MDCFKEQCQKFKKLHSSLQHNSVCLSTMRRKKRLKYIVAIGKHGFAVKSRHPTEAINIIAYLGCLLRMEEALVKQTVFNNILRTEISSKLFYSLTIALFPTNSLNKVSKLPFIFICVCCGYAPFAT